MLLVLSAMAAGGCGSREATAPSASADCDDAGPAVALNRNSDKGQGLADVIVVGSDGGVEQVTGDWVATKPSFSPDGRSLVVVRADGDYESAGPGSTSLWTIGTDGTGQRALTNGPSDNDPAWSPDGETIAFSQGREGAEGFVSQLAIVPSQGGDARALLPNESTVDLAPAWSPDGRQLAFIRGEWQADGSQATTIWVVAADGTRSQAVAAIPDAHSVEWHPHNDLLLVSTFAQEDGTVSLVDLDSGTETQIADHATFAAWSPDGESIYYFGKDGAPRESWWRLAEGRPVGERLERTRHVGEIEDYLYVYFGLAVRPCVRSTSIAGAPRRRARPGRGGIRPGRDLPCTGGGSCGERECVSPAGSVRRGCRDGQMRRAA